MTLAPEKPGAEKLVQDLLKNDVIASAGHTNGIYRELIPAIDEGISHSVHFFCNMSTLRRDNLKRVAGAVETILYDDRITTELICDGWHVGDILMKLAVKVKGVDRVCFVTDAMMAAGIECYKTFIRGLLDITDTVAGDHVVTPENTIRRDGEDPYLVVAADKGTASFSDIANGISADYGFWLDDAFASGGSAGYDISTYRHLVSCGSFLPNNPSSVSIAAPICAWLRATLLPVTHCMAMSLIQESESTASARSRPQPVGAPKSCPQRSQ